MNLPEAARIETLARRLALTPRELLALAARAAHSGLPSDPGALEQDLARVRAARDAAEAAAARVLLGHAGYALDDIDHGLLLAWAGVQGLDP